MTRHTLSYYELAALVRGCQVFLFSLSPLGDDNLCQKTYDHPVGLLEDLIHEQGTHGEMRLRKILPLILGCRFSIWTTPIVVLVDSSGMLRRSKVVNYLFQG